MALNAQLKKRIRQMLANYHANLISPPLNGELDFIKRSVLFLGNAYGTNGYETFITRSANIDKSPIVEFLHQVHCQNPTHREIGDILLVSKIIHYGRLVRYRAILVQSKLTKNQQMRWAGVDTAQLFLISMWPSFLRVKPQPRKSYDLSPESLLWGAYAFVAPNVLNFPIYSSPSKILEQNPSIFSQKSFTFVPSNLNGYNTSPSFLMRLIECQIGEDLLTNSNIRNFVEELYRMVDLAADPPDEFYWNQDLERDPEKGFGIIEFATFIGKEKNEDGWSQKLA
jgi:hypothetical protein